MSTIGQSERATQNRVIALFRNQLGYRYLGDWSEPTGNSNIEETSLTAWLTARGHTPQQIAIALHKLRTEASNPNRGLYGNNQAVYNLLRYGVPVRPRRARSPRRCHSSTGSTPRTTISPLPRK
jgi:type I restriction enzyme R subunit